MDNIIALREHITSLVKTVIDRIAVIENTDALVVDTIAIVRSGGGKRYHLTAFIGRERFTLIYAGRLLEVEWTTNDCDTVQTKWVWSNASEEFGDTLVPVLVLAGDALCRADQRKYIEAIPTKITEIARLTIPGYGSGLISYTVSIIHGLFYKYHFDEGLSVRVNFNMDSAVWVIGISKAGIWLKKTVHDIETATYYVTYGSTWSSNIPKYYHEELKSNIDQLKDFLLLDSILDINDGLYDSIINPAVTLFTPTPPDQKPW